MIRISIRARAFITVERDNRVMHAAFGRDPSRQGAGVTFHAHFPDAPAGRAEEPRVPPPTFHPVSSLGFGARRGPNWTAIVLIAAAHALALFALVHFDVIHVAPRKAQPLVVELISTPPPPPPAAVVPEAAPPKPAEPPIVAPRAVVTTPAAPPPPVVVTDVPPPVRAVVVAPAAPTPAASGGPVTVGDLSSKMLAGDPPRYPLESRRKREQGTVWLTVLLGLDGRVQDVSVARSSGFARLDKAALDAVRRWRWSPTLRDGQPVMVRGTVDIPFVLTS